VTLVLCGAAGCGGEQIPAADVGQKVFSDRRLSTSPFNTFSCATCHVVRDGEPAVLQYRLDSGYNLADTAGRASWWGGYETRLLDAINVCVQQFMGGGPLAATDQRVRTLYAYLESHSPTLQAPALPFTIVREIVGRPALPGDVSRGASVWSSACTRCHGAPHTGAGRLTERASVVPEDTTAMFGAQAPAVIVEKIRHGRFFNLAGTMPLYSLEVLSDQQVADLLVFLGL
jgi:thiosulfate dehydrogenase